MFFTVLQMLAFMYVYALFLFVRVCAFLYTPSRQTGITKLDDANHAGTARSQVRCVLDLGGVEA